MTELNVNKMIYEPDITNFVGDSMVVEKIQEDEQDNNEIDQEQYEFEQSVERDKKYARYE